MRIGLIVHHFFTQVHFYLFFFLTEYYFIEFFLDKVEAGFSVGFCDPTEKDDYSKLFTIFYVIIGTSVIGGSISVFSNQIYKESLETVSSGHSRHKRVFILFTILLFWILIGIFYGLYIEEWTFITSLYWLIFFLL